jgi:hypothetical protein
MLIHRLLRVDSLLIAVLLAVGVFLGGLQADDREPKHATISEDLEPLRSAFNANPDYVRAILLASPT